jgi:DNA-binding NarL/FixJ family response regulator
MCVKVLLGEDAEVMRRAIRNLLSEREDINVVDEVTTFPEVLQKATELKPDVIVFDLHMPGNNFSAPFLNGYRLLAISLATMMKLNDWLTGTARRERRGSSLSWPYW